MHDCTQDAFIICVATMEWIRGGTKHSTNKKSYILKSIDMHYTILLFQSICDQHILKCTYSSFLLYYFTSAWRKWSCITNNAHVSKYEHILGIFAFINSYSASHDNWCTATLWNRIMTAQCEGMGEVGSARYEPALLPPCPSIRVLSYSNCQEIHSRQQTGLAV